ncbi:MAG TPA: Ni/Fe-hydrogenase cytochrome b subunit [Candidatus Angelobacter sp.]|nr:Ni/Fe-hydrogenase cytochrome b subunit [Candidatus Angelobacter sp.]
MMPNERGRQFSFWQAVAIVLMLAGLYASYVRITQGLGGATNLSDQFPWGLWIGFDILCGVGLAAGGFTLAATVHIFNIERYKPILRPAILTAFLGYLLVILALMFDLGLPYRIWHPLVMWNPHSVMFEVGWCVTLYTTVLALEFVPMVFEQFRWTKALKIMHAVLIPLVILGVILSTLHQSSLGSLYLIVPEKLYPLWYTPLLPVMFFVSALCAGLAMTIFESWQSSKAFGKHLELPLLSSMGRILAVVLSVYLTMRFLDLWNRDALRLLVVRRTETYLFLLEMALFLAPAFLLFQKRVYANAHALYGCAVLALFGFVANRLNVSVTGMEAASGTHYFPKWTEVAVTLAIIALGFTIFRFACKHLPIFGPQPVVERVRARIPAAAPGD